jgi:hypothetical protein
MKQQNSGFGGIGGSGKAVRGVGRRWAGAWFTLGMAAVTSFGAGPLDNWVQRTSPTTNTLSVVTYGKDLFVAVGLSGTIVTSADGVTWRKQQSGTTGDIYGVTYGGDRFVAVGANGLVISSPNGTNWTTHPTGTLASTYTVAYGKGRYVAVGDVVLTSTDGTTWSSQNVPTATAQMRAFGEDGLDFPIIFPTPVTTHSLSAVTFTGDRFVAVGLISVIDPFFWSFSYYPKIITSTDGVTWSSRSVAGSFGLNDVTFGNAQYLAVGWGGAVVGSPNGSTWSGRTQPATSGLNSITFSEGVFVAVGEAGGIFTSSDGSSWTTRTSPVTKTIYEVTYGKDSFVAVGENGTILQSGKFLHELFYSRAADEIVLTWDSPEYVLEQNDTIENPSGWSLTPGGNLSPVRIKMESANKSFRLVKK